MNTVCIPTSVLKTAKPPDGDGSVQVHLDPNVKIGNAKVFAIYGKGEMVKVPPRQTFQQHFQNSVSGSYKLVATPNMTQLLRLQVS